MYQNNRDSRVFKDSKDGKAYFIDAIVFNGDIVGAFTGRDIMLGDTPYYSMQFIKSFPFTPKTFYIDVVDYRWKDKEGKTLDPNGDWWTHSIKDENQLKEVFEYYDQN